MNPGHSTHVEGLVFVKPTDESNDWMPELAPTISQSEVAASLSLHLEHILRQRLLRAGELLPMPPGKQRFDDSQATLTMLASSWGAGPPNVQVCLVVMS